MKQRLKTAYDTHGEKLRFLVVGAWNTAFSYLLFAALLYALRPGLQPLADNDSTVLRWMGSHYYLLVQWIAWVLAVPQSTLALKYFAFRSKGHWLAEIGRSYFVYVPLQLLSFSMLWFLSGVLKLDPLIGQLITSAVNAVLSYVGHKRFTFRAL